MIVFTDLRPTPSSQPPRLKTGINELDLVAGGTEDNQGFVRGTVTLLSADPGAGKSTLCLQAAASLARPPRLLNVAYISGEETAAQLQERAVRLKLDDAPVRLAATNRLDEALAALVSSPPAFLVVDSIQHMVTTSGTRSLPGSPGMAVAALRRIVAFARLYNTVAIVICHVTKSSRAAGPNTLQHDVDVLMHLEAKAEWRALRSTKNRYGSTNTPGLFRMKEDGLHGITRSQP